MTPGEGKPSQNDAAVVFAGHASSAPLARRLAAPYRTGMIRLSLTASSFIVSVFITAAVHAAQPLPRSSPEAQGVSSAGIQTFVEAADKNVDTMHSFMLMRHGKVVTECWWSPESAEKPHILYSLSKSFTSTAVGLAAAEGKLSIDDPVLKFFPDDAPAAPSDNLKAMRVKDLLTMSCGHQKEPKFSKDQTWIKTFLAHPVEHTPGTHFLYNSAATYACSAIVQKVTGATVLDYLKPRLFEPLGIENPQWSTSPQGISIGGWGLFLRTEDIAKFGQLFLQKGRWNDKQLVPAAWVEQATSKQVANGTDPSRDWTQGYGFQFWRCRHNAYRGDGAFGQFCIVLPEHDAVVAITADQKDMQAELNLVWDHLLPAFQKDPLPPNPDAEAKLKSTLTNLKVREGHTTNTIKLPESK
jgi:CubicO group peptidase (beta-lactamase class C family)